MAKLYWRVKLASGKWTYRPAQTYELETGEHSVTVVMEEESDPSEDYCRAVEEEE